MNFASLKLIAIIAGLSILIVAGAYLYKQNSSKGQTKQDQSSSVIQNNKGGANGKTSLPAPLQGSPSAAQIDKYVEDVAAQSVASSTLDMTSCEPKPATIKVKEGDTITIKNDGDKNITVLLTAKIKYEVAAKSSTQAKIDTGGGIYPLSCQEQGGSLKYRVGTFTVDRNVSF